MADVFRPGRRRFWFLPLIAAVVLAAAPRGAQNPPPKPQAESYPATMFTGKASGDLEKTLASLVPAPKFDDRGIPDVSRGWYETEPHPYLAAVLPGARFFLAGSMETSMRPISVFYDPTALLNGKLYSLRQLNRLLLDAGFPFDSASALTAAKMAVLFSLLGDQFTHNLTPLPPYNERWKLATQRPDSAQAFPAVEFRRVERDSWGVTLDCVVNGDPAQFYVQFDWPGFPSQPFLLRLRGDTPRVLFMFRRIVLPPARPSGGGWIPKDNLQWALAVMSGWTEVSPGADTHYFSVVKINNQENPVTLTCLPYL